MILDKALIFPIFLIVVIFGSLGSIQIILQNEMNKTLEQAKNNFDQTTQTQKIMNKTLDTLSQSAPQSNFTAQAEAIANVEYLIDAVDDIKRMLNETE